MTAIQLYRYALESPLGDIVVTTDANDVVHAITLAESAANLPKVLEKFYGAHRLASGPSVSASTQALARYFDGEFEALDSIVVACPGSPLQRQVWTALRDIPRGTLTHYGSLAQRLAITDRGAAWKVGQANAANPIPIVVPCHRVIGRDGTLTGFAWGLDRKRWLLRHEGAPLTEDRSLPLPGF